MSSNTLFELISLLIWLVAIAAIFWLYLKRNNSNKNDKYKSEFELLTSINLKLTIILIIAAVVALSSIISVMGFLFL